MALAPLLVADLRSPWSPLITAIDASPGGYGAVEASFSPAVVTDIGRVRVRWRMKLLPEGMRVFRENALQALEDFDEGRAAGEARAHEGWREVPAAVQRSPEWRVICARRWRYRAASHELEAHALLWAVRRSARARASQGQIWLFLSDNMSVVLAVAKGRATVWPLLSACRHLTALAFASSARLYVRWIASEGNPADDRSRRFQPRRGRGVGPGAPAGLGSARRPWLSLRHGCRRSRRGTSFLEVKQLQSRAAARRLAQRRATLGHLCRAERVLLERARLLSVGAGLGETIYPEGLPEEPPAGMDGLGRLAGPACEWEDILLEWLEEVFMSGKALAMGAKTVSALLWAAPHLGRPLAQVFPRVTRALRGWKCRSPGFPGLRSPGSWCVGCVAASWPGSGRTSRWVCSCCSPRT